MSSTVVPEQMMDLNIDPFKSEGRILLKLDKFSEFAKEEAGKQKFYSDPVFIRGLPWKIMASSGTFAEESCLSFYVECNTENKDPMWNCKAKYKLKVLSQNEGKKDCIMDHKRAANAKIGYGFLCFLSFEALMDPQNGWYNKEDDCIILAADITADIPQGLGYPPAEDVLIINKTKVNMNKHLLADHSDYFKNLFFNKSFSQDQEPSIHDPSVDVNAFKRLIGTMWPYKVPLDDFSIESVMFVARRFQLSSVMVKCEEFLLERSKKSAITKYRLAIEYDLHYLKKTILNGLKQEDFVDGERFVEMENDDDFKLLSAEAQKELLGHFYELYPNAKK